MIEAQELTGVKLIRLAENGDFEAWNKWSKNNVGEKITFEFLGNDSSLENLNFSNFVFTGAMDFSSLKLKNVDFSNVKFKQRATFRNTVFYGNYVLFDKCKFYEGVDFSLADFRVNELGFVLTKFRGERTRFNGVKFGIERGGDLETYSISFEYCSFLSKKTTFTGATFSAVAYSEFTKCKFIGDLVDYSSLRVPLGAFTIGESTFHADYVNFLDTKFEGPRFSFFRVNVFGNISFDGSVFERSNCYFRVVIFHSEFNFRNVRLNSGHLTFNQAVFSAENTDFQNLLINDGNVDFQNTKHQGKTIFAGSIFSQSLNFEETSFKSVPDFLRTQIAAHFTFHAMTIDAYDPMEVVGNEQDKYRRLKEIAIQSKDHEKEFEFFASELRAKNHEENIGIAKLPIWIYEIVSDFGRSIFMPFFGLVYTFMVYANIYAQIIIIWKPDTPNILGAAHQYSLAMLTPFAPYSRQALTDLRNSLSPLDSGIWLDILSVSETVLGIAFLFLIGLALRNRFRL